MYFKYVDTKMFTLDKKMNVSSVIYLFKMIKMAT